MKYVRIIIGVLLSVLILIVLVSGGIFLYLKYSLLTPERLSELVTREINERTNIEFNCEKVELGYWDSWPVVEIVVKGASFRVQDKNINASAPISGKFDRLSGSIQLLKLWKEHVVSIDGILLENPELHLNAQEKIPEVAPMKHRTTRSQLLFEIDRFQIEKGNVEIVFPQKNLVYGFQDIDVEVEGNLGTNLSDISLSVSTPQIRATGLTPVSLELACKGEVDTNHSGFRLSDAYFKIDEFPFTLKGEVMNLKKGQEPFVDLQFDLAASSIEDLLAFIPSEYLPIKDTYQVEGITSLKGKVCGPVKKQVLPDIYIQGSLEHGKFRWKELKEDLRDIQLEVEMNYTSAEPDSCYLKLNRLFMKGMQSEIDMQGVVTNLLQNPFIEAQFKGNLDFDYIGKKVLKDKNVKLAGTMKADARIGCSVDDLKKKNYHLIKGAGQLEVKNVVFDHTEKKIHFYIPGVSMSFGYAKNSSDFIKQDEVFSGVAAIDTLYLSYQDKLFVNLAGLDLRSNTAIPTKKEDAAPLTTHWNCKMLEARWDDSSVWASVQDMELHAGVKPVGRNLLLGESGLMFKAGKLKYMNPFKQQAVILDKVQLISEVRPTAEVQAVGGKYFVKGVLEFDRSQMYIPQFPMLTYVNHAYLSFQNNQLTLNRLQVKAGKSDCMLSGSLSLVTGKERKSGTSPVEGFLRILSANIDYDELEKTLSYGMSSDKLKDTKMMQFGDLNNLENRLRVQQPVNLKEQHPVYISKDISLELQLDLDHMNYRNVDLQHVQGSVFLKNQTLKAKLTTRTNLGKADLDLLYNSQKKEDVTACFDLKLKDFLVAQVHEVIPTVKTIFPLIGSMDGLVNCRLTAVGKLDNQMIPVLGATDAICSLDGHNLILMDNGTFQEIAHRFRFKNKEKNEISKLAANLILHKNQIEVLPFVLQWDRYKAIVGGEHSTDFTFNYHVDLVDSPIPIDFGLNLTGKEGQFKYKLRKCKYKELFKDGGTKYNQQVDVRLNRARQEIINRMQ